MQRLAAFCPSKTAPFRAAWLGPLPLTPFCVKAVPAELPGIYLLMHFSARSGAFFAFYVGQSCDLRRRLLEHRENGAKSVSFFRGLRATYFSVAHVRPQQLDDVERSLILLLQPPANVHTPAPLQPLLTTLPLWRNFGRDKLHHSL